MSSCPHVLEMTSGQLWSALVSCLRAAGQDQHVLITVRYLISGTLIPIITLPSTDFSHNGQPDSPSPSLPNAHHICHKGPEDRKHFLLLCQYTEDIRHAFLPRIIGMAESFYTPDSDEDLIGLILDPAGAISLPTRHSQYVRAICVLTKRFIFKLHCRRQSITSARAWTDLLYPREALRNRACTSHWNELNYGSWLQKQASNKGITTHKSL